MRLRNFSTGLGMEYVPTHLPRICRTHISVVCEKNGEKQCTYRPTPVLLQICFACKLLALFVLKGCAANQYFEKGNSEGPDIRFTGVMWETTSAFGGEVLCEMQILVSVGISC